MLGVSLGSSKIPANSYPLYEVSIGPEREWIRLTEAVIESNGWVRELFCNRFINKHIKTRE